MRSMCVPTIGWTCRSKLEWRFLPNGVTWSSSWSIGGGYFHCLGEDIGFITIWFLCEHERGVLDRGNVHMNDRISEVCTHDRSMPMTWYIGSWYY